MSTKKTIRKSMFLVAVSISSQAAAYDCARIETARTAASEKYYDAASAPVTQTKAAKKESTIQELGCAEEVHDIYAAAGFVMSNSSSAMDKALESFAKSMTKKVCGKVEKSFEATKKRVNDELRKPIKY